MWIKGTNQRAPHTHTHTYPLFRHHGFLLANDGRFDICSTTTNQDTTSSNRPTSTQQDPAAWDGDRTFVLTSVPFSRLNDPSLYRYHRRYFYFHLVERRDNNTFLTYLPLLLLCNCETVTSWCLNRMTFAKPSINTADAGHLFERTWQGVFNITYNYNS